MQEVHASLTFLTNTQIKPSSFLIQHCVKFYYSYWWLCKCLYIQSKSTFSVWDSAAIYETTSWLDEFCTNPMPELMQTVMHFFTFYYFGFMELHKLDHISAVQKQVYQQKKDKFSSHPLHSSIINPTYAPFNKGSEIGKHSPISLLDLAKGLIHRAWPFIQKQRMLWPKHTILSE